MLGSRGTSLNAGITIDRSTDGGSCKLGRAMGTLGDAAERKVFSDGQGLGGEGERRTTATEPCGLGQQSQYGGLLS